VAALVAYFVTWIDGMVAVGEMVKWSHIPLCRWPGTKQTR
jgi:hypothetical protein